MLESLKEQDSLISNSLFEFLKDRIIERRNSYADLLFYLTFKDENKKLHRLLDIRPPPKRQKIKMLMKIVWETEDDVLEALYDEEDNVQLPDSLPAQSVNANEYLQNALKKLNSKTESLKINRNKIEHEFDLFEIGGKKGPILDKATTSLLSIVPTSVESERAFSIGAYFCSKIRARLSSEMLSISIALKHYFNKSKN